MESTTGVCNAGGKKRKDGLTLEQVEELEGGVIRESKTGMAATKRADRRKQKGDPDGKYPSLMTSVLPIRLKPDHFCFPTAMTMPMQDTSRVLLCK